VIGFAPLFPARLILALLIISTGSGCSDGFGPSNFAGSYVLERVGADTLPAVVYTSEDISIKVLADTLRVHGDGRGTRATVVHITTTIGPQPENPSSSESGFTYRIDRGRVAVSFDCPPNANCLAPPHLVGQVLSDGLTIDYALGERVPQTYLRVP
jgi:hypothetical protein